MWKNQIVMKVFKESGKVQWGLFIQICKIKFYFTLKEVPQAQISTLNSASRGLGGVSLTRLLLRL